MAPTKILFALVIALCASQAVLATPFGEVLSGFLNTPQSIPGQAKKFLKSTVSWIMEEISSNMKRLEGENQKIMDDAMYFSANEAECGAEQNSISDILAMVPNDIRGCIDDFEKGVRAVPKNLNSTMLFEFNALLTRLAVSVKKCSKPYPLPIVAVCVITNTLPIGSATLTGPFSELAKSVKADLVLLTQSAGTCCHAVIEERVGEIMKIFMFKAQCMREKSGS